MPQFFFTECGGYEFHRNVAHLPGKLRDVRLQCSCDATAHLYLALYSPLVTMYRQFNIQQFYVLPTQRIMCSVWI